MSRSPYAQFPDELFQLRGSRSLNGSRPRASAKLQALVYAYIDLEAGRLGHVKLTQGAIAKAVGIGRQSVADAVRALKEVDLISTAPEGRELRYFVHHRGERAPVQLEHPDLSAHADRSPGGDGSDLSQHADRSGAGARGDLSAHADTPAADLSQHADRSRSETSFRIREEDDQQRSRPSSSSRSGRADAPTAWCPMHPGVEGTESLYTRGQFRHPLNGGKVCTFIVEAEPEPPPAAVNRAGSWEDVERLRAWREANA